MKHAIEVSEGLHDACGSGGVDNEACEPGIEVVKRVVEPVNHVGDIGTKPEQVLEQVDHELDVVERCSDVVEQVDHAYSDVGVVEVVANTGQVGGAGHGSRDDEVGGQVDQVSRGDGHGAVVNSGGCGMWTRYVVLRLLLWRRKRNSRDQNLNLTNLK